MWDDERAQGGPDSAKKAMVVVVTGAAGFLGKRVVRQLSDAGHAVLALVHRQPAERLWGPGVEVVSGDVTDPASLVGAFEHAQAAVHLAAVLVERGRQTFARVNVEGTRNVVAAAEAAGVQHLVHMSVVDAQPNRRYRYLQSRWEGEQAVQASTVPWTIVRAALLFGEGDAFFSVLARAMRLPSPVFPIIGDGSARFHPFAADEMARCIVTLMSSEGARRFYNLGGPDILTYEQMVDTLTAVIGLRRWKVHVPIPLVWPGAWVMERLLAHPLLTVEQLRLLEVDSVGELGLVEREFGFKPTPLREGLVYLQKKAE